MRKLSMLAVAAVVAMATPVVSQAQDKDIVETAVAAGSFKTLAKLLGDAGLVETLKGPGPFTVFAPTDEAFAKVPAATLEALGKDKAKLKSVLLYHVVAGKVMAADALKLAGNTPCGKHDAQIAGHRLAQRKQLDRALFHLALGGVNFGIALDHGLGQLGVAASNRRQRVVDGRFGKAAHARDLLSDAVQLFGKCFDCVFGHCLRSGRGRHQPNRPVI